VTASSLPNSQPPWDSRSPTPDPRLVAAIDLGGTKIRSLIVDRRGKVLGLDRRLTEAALGPQAVIERIIASVGQALAVASLEPDHLAGIGVAAPGPVDFHRGVILEAPNLPDWIDVPLAALLSERFGRPAFLENDANAAAVGEYRFGAGRAVDQLIYLTISTGIGGGLILDGRLYRGVDGTAGELGHIVIDEQGPLDDCGLRGCLEVLASGTAIARMGQEALAAGASGRLDELAEAGELTSKEIHAAFLAGDETAAGILARARHYLAIGLADFINIFNPQLFVIGGGVANMFDDYVAPAFEEARGLAFARPAVTARLLPAALGDNSGALGVAALVFDQLTETKP
jgi:glucokinase